FCARYCPRQPSPPVATIARWSASTLPAAASWPLKDRPTCVPTVTASNSPLLTTPPFTTGTRPGLTRKSASTEVAAMPKTTDPEKLARVEEVMKIILYGGELDDIRQYANSKEW